MLTYETATTDQKDKIDRIIDDFGPPSVEKIVALGNMEFMAVRALRGGYADERRAGLVAMQRYNAFVDSCFKSKDRKVSNQLLFSLLRAEQDFIDAVSNIRDIEKVAVAVNDELCLQIIAIERIIAVLPDSARESSYSDESLLKIKLEKFRLLASDMDDAIQMGRNLASGLENIKETTKTFRAAACRDNRPTPN